MLKLFGALFIGLIIGLVIGAPIIKLCKKLKLSQTILHYVDKHAGKSGTPTMGGWIFIVASVLSSACLIRGQVFTAILSLIIMLFYGLLGFLDDFIKVRYHQNEGLKPIQKIVGQVGISLVVSFYVYFTQGGGLEFFGLHFDIGLFIIPFIIIFYVAVTNSVNLLDGLDGLCGGVSFVYLIFFGAVLFLLGGTSGNLAIISYAMAGGLLAFIVFNGFPAKIFMGDTGSLALGGFIASIAVFSKTELLLPILGLLYVLTALSDILQVAYYKRTHKRIFKMAPLHHHFEKLGVHENKIVTIYIVITIILGLIVLSSYMFITGLL